MSGHAGRAVTRCQAVAQLRSADAGLSCSVSCLLNGELVSVIGRQLFDQALARESFQRQVRSSSPPCVGVPVGAQAVYSNGGISNAELISVFGGELVDQAATRESFQLQVRLR